MKRIFSIQCPPNTSEAVLIKWQNGKSKYLACASENSVNIYNRHGEHVDQMNLFGLCLGMAWDSEGMILAVITERSSTINFWNSASHRFHQVDTGVKESLTVLGWSSHSSQYLFIGTGKGNIVVYNHQMATKSLITGKHSKAITCGVWSENNLIAIASEDKLLTINTSMGETVAISSLNGEPSMIQFIHAYSDEKVNTTNQNCVSVVINKKFFTVITIEEPDNPFVVQFPEWYGEIVDYHPYRTGNFFVAFTMGFFVTVSTCFKNFGMEIFQVRSHKESLNAFSVCVQSKKVATCSENILKIFSMNDHNDIETVLTIDDEPSIEHLDWTHDGQLLALACNTGTVHIYLSQLRILGDNYGTSLAFLSSLLEVTVFNVSEDAQDSIAIVRIEIEPSLISIGPFHLAVAMNNRIWFYALNGNGILSSLANETEYVNIVRDCRLNGMFAAVLFTNGTIQFHSIEQNKSSGIRAAKQSNGAAAAAAAAAVSSHQQPAPNSGTYRNGFQHNTDDESEVFVFPETGVQHQQYQQSQQQSQQQHQQQPQQQHQQQQPAHQQRVSSITLNSDFCHFSLDNGQINCFVIEDWQYITLYRHTVGIRILESNFVGTRLAFIDHRNDVYVLNIATGNAVPVPGDTVPTRPIKILWESWLLDRTVFTVTDGKFVHVYSSPRDTLNGPVAEYVGKTKVPPGQFPLLLYNGVIVCQTQSGKTSNFILSSHDYSTKASNNPKIQREVLTNMIKLRRFQDAYKICTSLNNNNDWRLLAGSALENLHIDIALRVYTELNDYGTVNSLREYCKIEERNLQCAFVAELIGMFDLAQKLFLDSSQPGRALEMRKNLLHWNQALALAQHLSPDDVPYICIELAVHEQYGANYRKALDNFELALDSLNRQQTVNSTEERPETGSSSSISSGQIVIMKNPEFIEKCKFGIAKNSIFCGDIKRGVQMAIECGSIRLAQECAEILETLKHYPDAALLYEKSGNHDRAARLYLKVKNLGKLNFLLDRITDHELLVQLGKTKEQEKQYRQALECYQRAGEWLHVVRIQLEIFQNPSEAVKTVREHRSVDGAKLVAKYYQKRDDTSTAIEFLIISKCHDDAYSLAKSCNQMDAYSTIMEQYGDSDEHQAQFKSIALHYEQAGDSLRAGKFYCYSKLYRKGVKYLIEFVAGTIESGTKLDSTVENETIGLAIESAALAKDEQINQWILEFLIGERDGVPKDFRYLFKFYTRLKQFREAAKTAIIISREEQNSGNYRNAQQLLSGMAVELKRNQIPVPSEMSSNLFLVHSYLLAKQWIRAGDHSLSAILLLRICENLNKFQAHSVQILTTTVIQCQRAGYGRNALNCAHQLMTPDNRDRIDLKFKKKIETLVRKSAGQHLRKSDNDLSGELGIQSSACPYCDAQLSDNQFTCLTCRNTVPFCVASGMHIIRSELTCCPHCKYPARMAYMLKLLASNGSVCPLCEQSIDTKDIQAIVNVDDVFLLA